MLSNNSIDMYRVGGEPFGLEVIYKKGAPRGRMAVSVTESVVIAVMGTRFMTQSTNIQSQPSGGVC